MPPTSLATMSAILIVIGAVGVIAYPVGTSGLPPVGQVISIGALIAIAGGAAMSLVAFSLRRKGPENLQRP
ncbi:MAG: hypothetical protein ACYDDF_01305 [Thermoplasmatota archaeon]